MLDAQARVRIRLPLPSLRAITILPAAVVAVRVALAGVEVADGLPSREKPGDPAPANVVIVPPPEPPKPLVAAAAATIAAPTTTPTLRNRMSPPSRRSVVSSPKA
jgi:hypothetical protein